jgi:hypothetical protein
MYVRGLGVCMYYGIRDRRGLFHMLGCACVAVRSTYCGLADFTLIREFHSPRPARTNRNGSCFGLSKLSDSTSWDGEFGSCIAISTMPSSKCVL